MKIARNRNGLIVNITSSIPDMEYTCPMCGESLTRNFGVLKQYFSHRKGEGDDCELKEKIFGNVEKDLTESDLDILKREYYDKKFTNISTELSDFNSEEGYMLTMEQKAIIQSTEDKIVVSALAGSSKTTTMYYYCKERPAKKFLYLVYNSSMKKEADNTFGKLRNVEVRTIHSLAYKYVGAFYKEKLTLNYGAIDIIKDLGMSYRDQEIAIKVGLMMKEYMLSNVETFEELDLYDDPDNAYIKDEILESCHKLWALKEEYNNRVMVEHDFYLKLFQLSKKKMSNQYDCIVLDEAQDSSLLTLDLINNSQVKGVVCVGDKYQMLYSWRNAINILDKIEGATEYILTTSFRVGQSIANLANLLISDLTDTEIGMKGFNTKQKIVDKIDRDQPYACLSRTNSSLFEEVIGAIEKGKTKLYFEGGFQGYKFINIRDSYYFSIGHATKNPILVKFKNYGKMEEYAKNSKDIELLSLINMVKKYGSSIPSLVDSIEGYTIKSKDKAEVIFTTIHKSKGMTFKNMVICNDHMDLASFYTSKFIEQDKELKQEEFKEECCILYVAITRVSGEIELSDNYKEYLVLRHRFLNGQIRNQVADI